MIKKNKKQEKAGSKQRGKYKVVFRGHLLPGFDKEQVVANIVQLTKLPAEKIGKKFFSGKAVIIRRAHDEAHAQKLQQLFTQAGLEVIILKDTTKKAKLKKPEKPTKKIKVKAIAKKIKQYSRPIFALFLGAVVIALVMNVWNKYNITVDTPDEITAIEYSLANKPLLFLAHINLQRLLSRQSYFMGGSDPLPGEQTTLYKQLKKAGVDPQTSIKQILSAAYLEDQQLISQTVLLGQFSVAAVRKFFIKSYHGEVIPDADFVRLRISQINENSCEQENFMELSIEPERILIATDGHLSELRQLLSQAPGKVTDLNNWKQYRADKLASMVMFNPKKGNLNSVKSAKGVFSAYSSLPKAITETLDNKNKPLDSLFVGVGLQLLPPAGLLDVTLNSKDQAWLDQTQSDLLKQLENTQRKSSGLVNLQSLLSKIAIEQDQQPDLSKNSKGDIGQLLITMELDSELKKIMGLSLHEMMESVFSMNLSADASLAADKTLDVQERLEAAPLKYWPEYNQSKLKVFNEQFDNVFKPAWIEGPFAIAIDELLLDSHQDGDQVILQLWGKAQNIANVGSQQVIIRVTEVSNQQGNNLLEKEKCNQSAASEKLFTSFGGLRTAYLGDKLVTYNELEVRQAVKLKKGIKFSQVKSLTGEIELNLATKTDSKIFAKTEKNNIVTEYDSRILFKPSAIDSLAFSLSGNEKKVLLVRALNKQKQYLKRISQSSMENLFTSGHFMTQQYQGEIAFIEVVYATQLTKINYPFVVSKFPPYYTDEQWKFELEPAKLSSVAKWNEKYRMMEPLELAQQSNWNGARQASWHNGPLNLALYAFKTSKLWGTTGQLMIKTPLVDELRHNLSALEVYFRYPQPAENGDMGHSYFYPLKAKGYYMNGEYILNRDKPFMEGQLSFSLPYNNAAVPLTEINGDIIIHLPKSKHGSTYSDLSLGSQWEDEGVRTKIVRLGNDTMEFKVLSNRDRLLQITLMDANNQRLSTTEIQPGLPDQAQGGNIIVNYHGIPTKAVLTVSEGQQTKRYPFRLKLK